MPRKAIGGDHQRPFGWKRGLDTSRLARIELQQLLRERAKREAEMFGGGELAGSKLGAMSLPSASCHSGQGWPLWYAPCRNNMFRKESAQETASRRVYTKRAAGCSSTRMSKKVVEAGGVQLQRTGFGP